MLGGDLARLYIVRGDQPRLLDGALLKSRVLAKGSPEVARVGKGAPPLRPRDFFAAQDRGLGVARTGGGHGLVRAIAGGVDEVVEEIDGATELRRDLYGSVPVPHRT